MEREDAKGFVTGSRDGWGGLYGVVSPRIDRRRSVSGYKRDLPLLATAIVFSEPSQKSTVRLDGDQG